MTTQEIVDSAVELGKLLAKHKAVSELEAALKQFQEDVDSQRLFNDYQRHMAKIAEKEAQGDPIEVQDKQQLQKLQESVMHNSILRQLQIKQMDYLDLMRRVDEAIAGQSSIGHLHPEATDPAGLSAAGGIAGN